ncbi:putative odorant receptor 92a, partial [Malaya genurostris]|uniref:putative odorant receptor 92a n=1 Tax=Malaya genurostris TaxID=325434 RepID=UPI0026F3F904
LTSSCFMGNSMAHLDSNPVASPYISVLTMQLVQEISHPKARVLPLGLKVLQHIGLWGTQRNRFKYIFLVGSLVVVWIGPKLVFGPGKEGFNSLIRSTAEAIFLTENCITMVSFAAKNQTFEQLIDILECILQRKWPEQLEDEIESFNRRMEKLSKIYAIYIAFLLFVFLSVPTLTSVIQLITLDEADRGDFTLIYELQFYWLDILRNPTHFFIFTAFCYPASCCSAVIVALKGIVFQQIIYYGSKLFDLLAKRIDAMANIAQLNGRRVELREIIVLHQMALKYLEHLESTMTVILMNQMMSCTLVWCLMLFYVTKNFGPEAVPVIILFLLMVVEMAVYCTNGTILSDKAAKIANAMYAYSWYREPVDVQKAAQFIIQRAQKPAGVTAAKFYFVDIEKFATTAQATFSYYLILKNSL